MAKRHSADDELSGALAILNGIETSAAAWLPENMEQLADSDAAAFVGNIDAAVGQTSALVRFVRHLDGDIHKIIEQASDSESLSFHEKLMRRLHLSRTPLDMQRRDAVLATRLGDLLERAARLIGALGHHRQLMKSRLFLIEEILIRKIEQTKSIGDEAGAIADAAGQLTRRQDVVEALIRHEAVCNSLYHKLSIEAERGIVVLRALTGGQGQSLADRFSAQARETLSPLLALSEKGMLSMREVERRKHAIDENFLHLFNPAPVQRPDFGAAVEQAPQTQQASA